MQLGMKRCVERVDIERELTKRVDLSVLRWFGHMERMDESGWW